MNDTIQQRTFKGYAYISEIRALLSDMPFRHRRVQVGLMLRDAMFVSGILLNLEVWHSMTKEHIEQLEIMDRSLLKYIVKAHSKVQNEFIYLEMGIFNVGQIISCRRMLYLQTILQRGDEEITKKMYDAQKKSPLEGDWFKLVSEDFEKLGLDLNETSIKNCTKNQCKVLVKTSLRNHMFSELKTVQTGHSQIKSIKYPTFNTQEYLKTHMMNNHEVSLLFALRSKTVKGFKVTFPFNAGHMCPMFGKEEDTQEHCIQCEVTYPEDTRDFDINYCDIFSEDVKKQTAITKRFQYFFREGRMPVPPILASPFSRL